MIQTSVPKGIKCFGFSSSNSAIITGGGDRTLRIWLRKVLKVGQVMKYLLGITGKTFKRGNYNEPTGRMKGHLFIVSDILVHDVRNG